MPYTAGAVFNAWNIHLVSAGCICAWHLQYCHYSKISHAYGAPTDSAVKAKSKQQAWQKLVVAAVADVNLVFASRYLWSLVALDFSVKRETLSISTLQRGDFTVSVCGNGVLAPAI
ncbi:MAG: hypothetical protein ACI93R_001384 [Flavobacteriales bacterium]|jgi:hypothetical protein